VFGFNQSELSDEAKARLDAALQQVSTTKHFVIEVQGFTDKTGSRAYNLELSRRRAAAVVRYLAATRGIPLYRVHTIGYGPDSPVADNATRNGRNQNRRVDVKIYVADLGGRAVVSSLAGTP
jgi:outer membrane protein OmpA-like peptidoglycan-associated protein